MNTTHKKEGYLKKALNRRKGRLPERCSESQTGFPPRLPKIVEEGLGAFASSPSFFRPLGFFEVSPWFRLA